MKKPGMNISFMLFAEHRASGINIWMADQATIHMYNGKALLASYRAEYVTVESLRSMAASYSNVETKEVLECKTE